MLNFKLEMFYYKYLPWKAYPFLNKNRGWMVGQMETGEGLGVEEEGETVIGM